MSVTRRRSSGVLSAFVIALLSLTPAAAVDAADSPEAAVNELLDALGTGDLTRAESLVCEAERSSVLEMFDIGAQLGLPAGDVASPLTFRIDDRSTEVLEQDGDTATVRLQGTLSVEVDEAQIRDLVRTMLEAEQGPDDAPISDEDLDFMVPLITSAFSSGQAIDEEVTLVQEDGGWLVCGGLGGATESPDEFPADVSFAGLCGLVSVDQMSSLSELEFDSSQGFETTCTYSLSSYEDYHSATVSLSQGYSLDDLRQVFGVDEETSVAGDPAFRSGDQLFVEVGEDVLQISLYLGEAPPPDVDVLTFASQIAELFIPVLPELEDEQPVVIETPEPEAPSLCESLSLDDLNALGAIQYDVAEGSPGSCDYTSTATDGSLAFLSTSLDDSLRLDDLTSFFPDGEELTVAGRPAFTTMGQLWIQLDGGVLTIAGIAYQADGTQPVDPVEYAISVAEVLVPALQADAG